LYAGPNEDVLAIHGGLPKLDWTFTPTKDFEAMAGGGIPSRLPQIKIATRSGEELREDLKPTA